MLFIIIAGLVFANFSSSEAPIPNEQYTVYVSWNGSECSCGEIEGKLLDIELWDIHGSTEMLIDYAYNIDITNESQPYEHIGYADIIWNCQECYSVRITVEYYDSEGLCCDGANSVTCDGEDLINDGVPISANLD